jgi:hypothetical protein
VIGWSEKTMLNLTDGYVAAVDHEGDVAYGFVDVFMRGAEDRGAAGEGFDVAGGNPVGMRGLAEMVVGIVERCGVRHGLHERGWITRFVSARVSLERGVMMGLAMFLQGLFSCCVCFWLRVGVRIWCISGKLGGKNK